MTMNVRMQVEQPVAIRPAILYLITVFAAGWTLGLTYWFHGGRWHTPSALVIVYTYKMIPLCIALLFQLLVYRDGAFRQRLSLRLNPSRWYLAAWLAPLGITFAAIGVGLMMPGTSFSPELEGMAERFFNSSAPAIRRFRMYSETIPLSPLWSATLFGMSAGVLLNLLWDFGVEAGWRGVLHTQLAAMGFWRSSLFIGVLWGIWYAPLILQGHNFPINPGFGVLMMTLCCTLVSPPLVFIKIKTGSMLGPVLMHSAINGTGMIAVTAIRGGSDLAVGITGVAGIVVLAGVNGLLWIYLRSGGTLHARSHAT